MIDRRSVRVSAAFFEQLDAGRRPEGDFAATHTWPTATTAFATLLTTLTTHH